MASSGPSLGSQRARGPGRTKQCSNMAKEHVFHSHPPRRRRHARRDGVTRHGEHVFKTPPGPLGSALHGYPLYNWQAAARGLGQPVYSLYPPRWNRNLQPHLTHTFTLVVTLPCCAGHIPSHPPTDPVEAWRTCTSLWLLGLPCGAPVVTAVHFPGCR